MSKFELYNIVLKDINDETRIIDYDLDDAYFKKIDSPEVQKGNVKAKVTVQRKQSAYELQFLLDGSVFIPCDRCLDEMEQQIHYKEKLQVKFGDKFADEDDFVIVPEYEGAINVAWFLYEFIVLNIPIKHVHATGECNKTMVSKLKRHITHQKDDDSDESSSLEFDDDDDFTTKEIQTDPRWDSLQNITENN
jgi:Predicted metal-binding, possibly nucleic acid-binding protein